MGSRGCWVDVTKGHQVKVTNEAVWLHWRAPPVRVELAVRRVKWYQDWAIHRDDHGQVLGAAFGVLRGQAVLDACGQPVHAAHTWAMRVVEDLEWLAEASEDFASVWEDSAGDLRILFNGGELSARFAGCDAGVLRGRALQAMPLGSMTHFAPADPAGADALLDVVCGFPLDRGRVCSRVRHPCSVVCPHA